MHLPYDVVKLTNKKKRLVQNHVSLFFLYKL